MSAMTSFTLRSLSKNRARTPRHHRRRGAGCRPAHRGGGFGHQFERVFCSTARKPTTESGPLDVDARRRHRRRTRRRSRRRCARDARRRLIRAFDEGDRRMFGRLLSVVSLEGDTTEMTGFKTSEDACPRRLTRSSCRNPSRAPTFSGAARSSSGRRRPSSSDSASRTFATAPTPRKTLARPKRTDVADYQVYSGGIDQRSSPTATCFNSCDAYRSADEGREPRSSRRSRTRRRAYTVVGFYESRNLLTWTPNGCLAFTGADPSAAGPTRLYVSTSAFDSMADMEDHLKSTLGDTFLDYHSTLSGTQASPTIAAAWSTLYRSRRSSRR